MFAIEPAGDRIVACPRGAPNGASFERWIERRRAHETDPEALQVLRRGWGVGSGQNA